MVFIDMSSVRLITNLGNLSLDFRWLVDCPRLGDRHWLRLCRGLVVVGSLASRRSPARRGHMTLVMTPAWTTTGSRLRQSTDDASGGEECENGCRELHVGQVP